MAQEREKDFLISEKMKPFLNENGVLFYILYEDKLVVLQAFSKDDFGYCGGFPFQEICLTKIFDMYLDDSIIISTPAILYTLGRALGIVWEKTIAHEENKKRASVVIPIVSKILQRISQDIENSEYFNLMVDIASICISSLWSFCYGVVENHALVFEQGSIPVLVNLFQYKDLEYNISGTFWHLFETPYICEEVFKLNGLRYLSDIPHRLEPQSGLVASLALSRLSRFGSPKVQQHLFELKALDSIVDWVKSMDINTFRNPFVWTTMKPLLELIESEYYQVRLLGCFLLVVTLKNYEREDETGQYTQGKLLFEGTSNLLRKIIETEHCDLIVKFASLASSQFIPLKDISVYRSKGMLWNLLKHGAFFHSEEVKEDMKEYFSCGIPFVLGWKDSESVINSLPFDIIQYVMKMLYSI